MHFRLYFCSLLLLNFFFPSLSFFFTTPHFMGHCSIPCCLFVLSPTFPFPSLPPSHLCTVPVTYAWRDELIRKAEKAISKALGKDKPSTSRSALSSRQSSRGAPRQFDHLDDQSVSIYIHVHSYSNVHVPRSVHIMPQSGCVARVTN